MLPDSDKVRKLSELTSPCRLCPHRCGAARDRGERGKCGVGLEPLVASAGPHFGEEPELVGSGGSGTIFFAGCNLSCVFCQNYEISHLCQGRETTPADVAELMLALERRRCENINLVTPTHVAPAVAAALALARARGLSLPIVYNCGGYESVATLELLEGFIDIYMPDMKYGPAAAAAALSDAPGYFTHAKAALQKMHRQVGVLTLDGRGVATRGVLIRHLVLPENLADSEPVLQFIADELSPDSYVNIMAQYRPYYRAHEVDALGRPPTRREMAEAKRFARGLGLLRGLE